MAHPPSAVLDVVGSFVTRATQREFPIGPDTRLQGDESALNLDSLQTAELSALLEDALGSDPFSEGILPLSVAEIIAFYAN